MSCRSTGWGHEECWVYLLDGDHHQGKVFGMLPLSRSFERPKAVPKPMPTVVLTSQCAWKHDSLYLANTNCQASLKSSQFRSFTHSVTSLQPKCLAQTSVTRDCMLVAMAKQMLLEHFCHLEAAQASSAAVYCHTPKQYLNTLAP